jgi:hypothetical protein
VTRAATICGQVGDQVVIERRRVLPLRWFRAGIWGGAGIRERPELLE